jgi:hypothetical protein
MQARIDSNYKSFIFHPDLGIRLKAEARTEAYRLMLAQVEEVLLSQKEVPLGQCTRCFILEKYTPEKTLFGGLCGRCDAEVDPEPAVQVSSVCNGEFCTGCGNHEPV